MLQAATFADNSLSTLPGVQANAPWSPPSLQRAESLLLLRNPEEIDNQTNINYQHYLGEGLRRLFGGHWVVVDPGEFGLPPHPPLFGVAYDDRSSHVDLISSIVDVTFTIKTGHHWISLYESTNQTLRRISA